MVHCGALRAKLLDEMTGVHRVLREMRGEDA